MATTFDQMYRYKLRMMMTSMKVIQRSSKVWLIMPYGFQTLSEVSMNQIGDNHVLNRGQMLTEVKRSKVCFTTTSLGLKHQIIKMFTLTLLVPLQRAQSCLVYFIYLFFLNTHAVLFKIHTLARDFHYMKHEDEFQIQFHWEFRYLNWSDLLPYCTLYRISV